MSLSHCPKIVTDDTLIFCLDAGNTKSYSGSGTDWKDLLGNSDAFDGSTYTYPSFGTTGNTKYFTFVNNGTTINNIKNGGTVSVNTQTVYSRLAWFYQTSQSSAWAPIIQNSIGNNSDMGLTTSGNKLHFRQYKNSNNGVDGDSGYTSTGSFSNNVWVFGAITVNLTSRVCKFYINGEYDSQASLNIIGNSNSNVILIGGADTDSYSGDRMFKGRIATAMHYNRVLTDGEVLQNFNALRGRFGV